jgi:hypothetical protein
MSYITSHHHQQCHLGGGTGGEVVQNPVVYGHTMLAVRFIASLACWGGVACLDLLPYLSAAI